MSLPVWSVLLAFAFAFGVVCVLTPLVIGLARRRGWVAAPSKDRWHAEPTALMGGIAIFGGVLAVMAGAVAGGERFEAPLLWAAAGALGMFVTGVVDDRRPFKPATKLLLQMGAAGLVMAGGIGFHDLPLMVSMPLTFVWIIGITNAINLLDNMDGLASGISGIAAAVLGLLALLHGQPGTALAAFALAGACAGFLVFNFKPARIFMGDGGSLFLGFSVASLSIIVAHGSTHVGVFGMLAIPAAIMAVPIFDTTLVTVLRTLAGRAVSQGGRDHASHRLVMLGFSERTAVLVLYGVSILFGTLTLVLHVFGVRFFLGAFVLFVTGLLVLGRVLADLNIYPAEAARPRGRLAQFVHANDGVVIRTVMRHKRLGAGLLVDALLLMGSHLLAYALRFEYGIPAPLADLLVWTLPIVMLFKLVLLHVAGLRTQVWRHTGALDIARILAVVVAGAVFTLVLYAAMSERGLYSGAVVAFDAVLSFTLLVGVRVGVRGLRSLAGAQRVDGEPVVIYGAGEAGALVLNELRHNARHALRPVAFVDDEPDKQGASVGGLRVIGTAADLDAVCAQMGTRRVLLAIPSLPAGRVSELQTYCAARGLTLSRFVIRLVDLTGEFGDGHSQSAVEVSPRFAS